MGRSLRICPWRTKEICAALLLLVPFASAPVLEAAEGKRVAFVVGIGAYDNLAPDKQLRNAVNDADGVGAKLKEIGFQVTLVSNIGRSSFNATWQNVIDSLTNNDTFVLFFSGHGVQVDGQNYLLPGDIPFIQYGRQAQLTREAISLNELLTDLSTGDRPHPKNSVVILDACRNNPLIPPGYKGDTPSRGLAKVPEPQGIFVMYAAASNTTALDHLSDSDTSKYSLFTRTLLPLMGRRDLSVLQLTKRLQEQVSTLANLAGRDQRPAYYDGTVGEFCLPGCADKADKSTDGLKESFTPTAQPVLPSEKTGKDGVPMVLIPAGKFTMGSSEDDKSAQYAERPTHTVYLDAYYLDQFEVTTARYATFLQRTSRVASAYWSEQILKQHGNKPVVGVDWNDATAYCVWAGKRLPTEAEWEKAARGTDHRLYPWGDAAPNQRLANYGRGSDFKNYEVLTNVGSYELGKSPYGAYDMAGNVWEWTADWYDENYYGKSSTRNPKGSSSGQSRVVRGGSWGDASGRMRSTLRDRRSPTGRHNFIGFRCVQDVPN